MDLPEALFSLGFKETTLSCLPSIFTGWFFSVSFAIFPLFLTLNIGGHLLSSDVESLLCSVYVHSLGDIIQLHGSKDHLYTNDSEFRSPSWISSFCIRLPINLSICVSAGISNIISPKQSSGSPQKYFVYSFPNSVLPVPQFKNLRVITDYLISFTT